ncbi:MAG: tyrosine--tRNA ligase [Candidatus Komeilibacteria bacterium]|nr:tyrosine--tRNA ligase [Candidatus Komeilibacteria bacterium]
MTKPIVDNQKIEELLTRGVDEVIDKDSLRQKLLSGKQLRIKLGIDPTSPNLHLGRSIPLLKLKDFQDLGHQIVFIVGDFTGVIGDTSDKDSERPMLTAEAIKKNMKDYTKQAGKIIDLKKCEVQYNSKWLAKLTFDKIGEQADQFSVAEFIARENIKKRLDNSKRVSLREMLYPLMQGYDSVMVKADVEIGGTDQRFNLLAGRKLQNYFKQAAQDIILNPLIEGIDGRKMSSSWGNTINLIDEPGEMFGRVMSLNDELIIKYFILTTRLPMVEIKKYEQELKLFSDSVKSQSDSIEVLLAKEIVTMYHSAKAAELAEVEFNKIFRDKERPSEIPKVKVELKKWSPADLLVKLDLVSSKAEAQRLIAQGGVRLNDRIINDWRELIEVGMGDVIQVGKRNFVEIK